MAGTIKKVFTLEEYNKMLDDKEKAKKKQAKKEQKEKDKKEGD